MLARFNGHNNGVIAASSRDLAEAIGSHRYAANRASLGELIEAGLIVPERVYPKGSRMATEYRLTWIESGNGAHRKPATNEWKTAARGNRRKSSGAVSSTRNRKHADAPSTERKLHADAPSTGEVEKPQFRADASSTLLVSHVSDDSLVPFPAAKTLGNIVGQNRGGNCEPSCGMDLDELRTFALAYLHWAGSGAQSRLADSTGIPGGSLSKFLSGRSLASAHRLPLQLAIGKAWPVQARGAA
jgi:hypothetical protein